MHVVSQFAAIRHCALVAWASGPQRRRPGPRSFKFCAARRPEVAAADEDARATKEATARGVDTIVDAAGTSAHATGGRPRIGSAQQLKLRHYRNARVRRNRRLPR